MLVVDLWETITATPIGFSLDRKLSFDSMLELIRRPLDYRTR